MARTRRCFCSYLPGNLPWTERGNTLGAELIAPALAGLLAGPVRN